MRTFASDGDEWKQLRSFLNPVIARPDIVHSYIQRHGEVIDNLVSYLASQIDRRSEKVLEADDFEKTLKYLAFERESERQLSASWPFDQLWFSFLAS